MTSALVSLIISIAVLLIVWFVCARFSPDPLITKIVQIIIFVIALIMLGGLHLLINRFAGKRSAEADIV